MLNKVLVTGGAGFIGTHLVSRLLHDGSEVIVIDKVAKPGSFPASKGLTYKRMDAYRINNLNQESLNRGGIVHLAAETSVERSVQYPVATIKSNIGVTCAALELARKLDSERFVFASTAAVYGDHSGRCHETDSPRPASPYAASKLASEHYCNVYCKLYGIRTVILRYFNVYGPGQSSQYAGAITRFVKRVLEKKPPVIFGDGNQSRDFVFIDDVVSASLASLKKPLKGGTTMNIGTGKPVKIKTLAHKILDILNAKQIRPLYSSPRKGDIRHSFADIFQAKKQINFRPRYDLETGLRATIEWFGERTDIIDKPVHDY